MPSAAFKKALGNISKKIGEAVKPADQNKLVKKLILDSPRLSYEYGGGVKIGCFHRYMGPESGGKSTICTYIASQFQKHLAEQHPDLANHKIVVYLDFERSFDPEHAVENGLMVDEDHFCLLQPDCIEDAAIALEEMIKTNEVSCIIFDSESMAPTRTSLVDDFNKASFGGGAKAMKEFCNRFNVLCANYNTTMFVISQERAQMQMGSHAIATTGGFALKYAASTMNRVRKIENIVENNKVVGIHMQVRNYKNKTGIPFRDCEMDLFYKGGFDSTCEYVDFLKEFNEDERLKPLCYAGGAGMFTSEKFDWKIRGKDNLLNEVKAGTLKGWDEIKEAIDDIISHEIEGKENSGNEDQLNEQNEVHPEE